MEVLDDHVLSKVLALGSEWPYSRIRAVCRRFSRLNFLDTARSLGIDDTLMLFSKESAEAWILHLEDRRWAPCARVPTGAVAICRGRFIAATGTGPEIFASLELGQTTRYLAFNPTLNQWRDLPVSSNIHHCSKLVTLDDGRVVAAAHRSDHLAIYDSNKWTPLPLHPTTRGQVPSNDYAPLVQFALNAVGLKVFVCAGLNCGDIPYCKRDFYVYDVVQGTWTKDKKFTSGPSVASTVVQRPAEQPRIHNIGYQPDALPLHIYDPSQDRHTKAAISRGLPSWFRNLGYTASNLNGKLVLFPGGRPDMDDYEFDDPDPRPAILTNVCDYDVALGYSWDEAPTAPQWDETTLPSLDAISPDDPAAMSYIAVPISPVINRCG